MRSCRLRAGRLRRRERVFRLIRSPRKVFDLSVRCEIIALEGVDLGIRKFRAILRVSYAQQALKYLTHIS
jgi:hypothetical protein